MSDLRIQAEKIVDKKIKFYKNLCSYLFVNLVLFIINWYFTPEFWWVSFPMFFWGIGIISEFIHIYVFTDNDFRESKIKEEMEKLRN